MISGLINLTFHETIKMKTYQEASRYFAEIFKNLSVEEFKNRLSPKKGESLKLPNNIYVNNDLIEKRWDIINNSDAKAIILDHQTKQEMSVYERNIENFIGTVNVPVGLAGPLRINGLFAQGDYYVPLATTEAALVASYSRGAQLITAAGGGSTAVINKGICRAPGFILENLTKAILFVNWIVNITDELKMVARTTTSHGELVDIKVTMEGNYVFVNFDYFTADASGQNMITIATQKICEYIMENSPVTPEKYFIEGNLSGDKKASSLSFLGVRGKKVISEVIIKQELVRKFLRTTPEEMITFWKMSTVGAILLGTTGFNGHFANGLTALYIACGQDAACVVESAVGITRMEVQNGGDLYVSVSLPNVMVGTVGGGTGLPSQKSCLDILNLSGENNSMAFAEVAAATVLAGELSIAGAITAGDFTHAHQALSRDCVLSRV